MGHLLMESANALIVDAALTRASGTAEREAALAMLARRGKWRGVTHGDDAANPRYIVNERGVDYRMCSPVGAQRYTAGQAPRHVRYFTIGPPLELFAEIDNIASPRTRPPATRSCPSALRRERPQSQPGHRQVETTAPSCHPQRPQRSDLKHPSVGASGLVRLSPLSCNRLPKFKILLNDGAKGAGCAHTGPD